MMMVSDAISGENRDRNSGNNEVVMSEDWVTFSLSVEEWKKKTKKQHG